VVVVVVVVVVVAVVVVDDLICSITIVGANKVIFYFLFTAGHVIR